MTLVTWSNTTAHSLGDNTAYCVGHGNGVWIVGGGDYDMFSNGNGIIRRSTNGGYNWSNIANPFAPLGIVSAVHYANGVWVAVGGGATQSRSSVRVAVSTDDGLTWNVPSSIPALVTVEILNDVYYSIELNQWVAVGNGGRLWTATDPSATWTAQTSQFGSLSANCIRWSGITWVAAGNSGHISTSSDGTTWVGQGSIAAGDVYSLSYGCGQFTCIESTGRVGISSDGINWVVSASNMVPAGAARGLGCSCGLFLAVAVSAGANASKESIDSGASWQVESGAFPSGGMTSPYGGGAIVWEYIREVAYDGAGTFVAVGIGKDSFSNTFGMINIGSSPGYNPCIADQTLILPIVSFNVEFDNP